MTTRDMATEYRLTSWAEAIQERVANGETIKEFCERRGVKRHSYFYWQRRLREIAAKQMDGGTGKATQALVPSGWAQASTVQEAQGAAAATLSIEIGGYRVVVTEGTPPEVLAKVCRVLGALC